MVAIIFLIVLLVVGVLGARYGVDSRFDRPGRQLLRPAHDALPAGGAAGRRARRWLHAAFRGRARHVLGVAHPAPSRSTRRLTRSRGAASALPTTRG